MLHPIGQRYGVKQVSKVREILLHLIRLFPAQPRLSIARCLTGTAGGDCLRSALANYHEQFGLFTIPIHIPSRAVIPGIVVIEAGRCGPGMYGKILYTMVC
jgi:hypothetical protein